MTRPKSFGLIAFFNIMMDGRDSVVTPIINDNTTRKLAPLASNDYAIGIHPKMSAYIGTPAIVAMMTPNGLEIPRNFTIISSGIQL